jgi:hypothetical protein
MYLVSKEILSKRRKEFLEKIRKEGGEKEKVCFIFGATSKFKTQDVEYRFRQDSDFLYLPGIEEEGCSALFIDKKDKRKFVLFIVSIGLIKKYSS